jgi:hypothetical protein
LFSHVYLVLNSYFLMFLKQLIFIELIFFYIWNPDLCWAVYYITNSSIYIFIYRRFNSASLASSSSKHCPFLIFSCCLRIFKSCFQSCYPMPCVSFHDSTHESLHLYLKINGIFLYHYTFIIILHNPPQYSPADCQIY